MSAPPPKRRSSAVARRRGRRGGRPVEHPRTVPPASEAVSAPPGREVFPVPAAQWALFCEAFGDLCGKLRPAADAAGLDHVTVTRYFRRAAAGEEPYRTAVEQAVALLARSGRVASRGVMERNPLEWMHRAYPHEFPRAPARIDLRASGDVGLIETIRREERERAAAGKGDE